MRRRFVAVALISAGCGSSTLSLEAGSEPDRLAQLHHELNTRLEEKFGKGARVQQLFGLGQSVVLGVALEPADPESDLRPPLALARYHSATDELTVISDQAQFKEALVLPQTTALVTADGELRVRAVDGTERTLAADVKGEVTSAPSGGLLFTLEGTEREGGDSAVVLSDPSGALVTIADGEGVDDRPSISPDGKTVVFVSGRTGIASLWRTTAQGGAPVQLTNVGIEAGQEREGAPEGFVPVPVTADRLEWVSADAVRFDAGEGEFWRVDVRTGVATREGGAR